MSEELMPCPFCGQQEAFVEQLDSDASVVICQGMVDEHSACLARGPVGVQQSEMEDQPGRDAAIAEWNRRAQPAEAEVSLADRMRAAGMMTIEEMLAEAPLDRFIKHAGVNDLEKYGQWLDMKCREFLSMQASRELGKREDDDLYEWVLAHAAAFQEARINFKAARDAHLAALSAVTAERDRLREDSERLKRAAQTSWNEFADSVGELDQLRAEVEMLRKDAERYRWTSIEGNWVARMFGKWRAHTGEYGDAQPTEWFPSRGEAIDAAMAAKESTHEE